MNTIVQAMEFDPKELLGNGSSVKEQDERSLKLSKIDLKAVMLLPAYKGEGKSIIRGRDMLNRAKARGHILVDLRFFVPFMKNPERIPLDWVGTPIYCMGTVLEDPQGDDVVFLMYHNGQKLLTVPMWLDHDFVANEPVMVLAA